MQHGCHRAIFGTQEISDAERSKLGEELFRLHQCIFAGVDREAFEATVINPPARWTRVQVIRSGDDQPLGYCAVHLYDMWLHDRHHVVFRGEAGILRQYRGEGTTFAFGFREALFYKLLHPLERVYFFCTLVHPSSYHLLAQRFWELYPSHRRPTPAVVQKFMYELADAFGEPRLAPDDPAIRQVGWITRDSEDETSFWHGSNKADVQLFLRLNPGYCEGQGLVTLVPLTFGNLILTAARMSKHRLLGNFGLNRSRRGGMPRTARDEDRI